MLRYRHRNNSHGFTLVELLIVVVVITILAAITFVTYSGVRQRAIDARIRAGVSDFEKAIHRFSIKTGKTLASGSGSTGPVTADFTCPGVAVAGGWVGSTTYSCTAEDILVAAGTLPAGFTAKLPGNPHYSTISGGRLSIMLYQCGPVANKSYALYWSLSNPTTADTTSINTILTTCGNGVAIRDSWGMRAAKIIKL